MLGAGSHRHATDRATDRRPEIEVHHCHRDAQFAAGRAHLRSHPVLSAGQAGRGKRDSAHLLAPTRESDRRLRDRTVWMTAALRGATTPRENESPESAPMLAGGGGKSGTMIPQPVESQPEQPEQPELQLKPQLEGEAHPTSAI